MNLEKGFLTEVTPELRVVYDHKGSENKALRNVVAVRQYATGVVSKSAQVLSRAKQVNYMIILDFRSSVK